MRGRGWSRAFLAHSVESAGEDGVKSFQQVHPEPYFVVTNGDRICWAYGGYSIG